MATFDDFKVPDNNQGQPSPPVGLGSSNLNDTNPGDGFTPPPQQPVSPMADFQPPQAFVNDNKPPKKRGFLKTFSLLLLVLLILAGGAYAAMTYLFNDEEPVATPTITNKKPIDKITYGVIGGPVGQFYPAISPVSVLYEVNLQMFEGLATYQDKTKVVPLLAQSWTNPSDTVWQFKLKTGVKFHSGNIMTAKDVKYTIDLIKKESKYKDVADLYASTVKSVEVVDDSTVKITTSQPDANLLNKLVFIGILDAKTKPGDSKSGTGPYIVKEGTKPTDNDITLSAFSGYHGGTVYTKEVQYKVYTASESTGNAAAIKDLEDDKLNIIQLSDAASIKSANEDKLNVYKNPSLSVQSIILNTLKSGSPLQKLAFRQSLLYGIDIDKLIKDTGRTDTAIAANQYVTKDIPGYNDSITRPKRDVKKAKEYLKEAGYANGATITIVTSSGTKDVVENIKKQLAEVGITVTVQVEDDDDKFNDAFIAGQYESWYSGYSPDTLDAEEVFGLHFQSPWYKNTNIDKLLAELGKTFDQADRLTQMKGISKELFDDVALLPLYTPQSIWALDSSSYVMNTDLPNSELGVFFWKVYQK